MVNAIRIKYSVLLGTLKIHSKTSHLQLLTQPLAEALPGCISQSKPDEQRSPAQASQARWVRRLRAQVCRAAQPAEPRGELCQSWGSASGGTAVCNQVCHAPPVLLTTCIHPPEASDTVIACKFLFRFIILKLGKKKTKPWDSPPPSTLETQERYVLGFLT